MPTQFMLSFSATSPTVPAPKKGSSTVPSGGHEHFNIFSGNSGGNVAKCASLHGLVFIWNTSPGFLPWELAS